MKQRSPGATAQGDGGQQGACKGLLYRIKPYPGHPSHHRGQSLVRGARQIDNRAAQVSFKSKTHSSRIPVLYITTTPSTSFRNV